MNSCILCPIYDKERDFNYALDFYASKLENDIATDIIFIFSYKSHQLHFEELFNIRFPKEKLVFLTIPEELNKYKSPVTVKKLFGVFSLYEKYSYIGVVDCECLFIKESVEMTKVFDDIWNSRSFLVWNKSYLLYYILKTTVQMSGLENDKRLKKDTKGYVYNCWFCDIPVYRCDTVAEFKMWFYEKDVERLLNNRNITDYYLYVLFLYEVKGFSIKKINYWSPWGIMEDLVYSHTLKCDEIENEIGTHWTSNPKSKNERAVILFHLDHRFTPKEFRHFLWESRLRYYVNRYFRILIKIKKMMGL